IEAAHLDLGQEPVGPQPGASGAGQLDGRSRHVQPEVATTPPPNSTPVISPGAGDSNVDPLTTIQITFTEPVQPGSVGSLPNGHAPVLSAAVSVQFGPSNSRVNVPFTVLPASVFD